ncbi:penicillin-binding protein [Arthrobacter pigmenti]
MQKIKRVVACAAVAALAASASACTDDGPSPEPAARKLASALSSMDVSKISFTDAAGSKADKRLEEITAGMGEVKPKVSVASVEVDEDDDDAATAKLRYTWDLEGTKDWSYTTKAKLARGGGDKWHPAWTPAVVAPGLKQGEALTMRSTPGDRAEIRGADGEELTASSPILGSVGQATGEIVESSKGTLEAGDTTGLSGLQYLHNKQLSGPPGITVLAAPSEDATGQSGGTEAESRVLFESKPAPGKALQTTLDNDLQLLAEDVLQAEDSASAIVAMRPSSGEILAAADGPAGAGSANSMLGQYPPGSTFKVATSLGLIREGMTPESTVSCTDTYQGFQNAPTYPDSALGDIPLKTAVAQSCNTAFISESETVSQRDLASAAAALGIGVETELGYPAFFGSVPAKADPALHAVSMFGQGEVQVSPLSLATMAASVGEGDRVTPKLLEQSASGGAASAEPTESAAPSAEPTGSAAPSAEPTEAKTPGAGTKPVTEEEAAMLRQMMRGVVTQGGASMLQDIPGAPVIAKTGTAEFGSGSPPKTHAWMVAVHGDLAVAVFVEEGEYGSTSGGPLMEAFLEGAAQGQSQ